MVVEQAGSHDFRAFIPYNAQSKISSHLKEFKGRKNNSQEKKLSSNENTHLFAAVNGKGTSGGHQNHNSNFTERKLFRRIESRLSL